MIITRVAPPWRSHWDMPNQWYPGTRKYAFHLTLEQSPQVHRVAERLAPLFAKTPEVDPVPREWLHLTMTGLGPVEQVSDEQLEVVADQVFEGWQQLQVAPLLLNTAHIAEESVVLTGATPEWLDELVQLQRRTVDTVLGAREWRPFWPHVSLAYYNTTPDEQLSDDVGGALEDVPPPSLQPVLTLLRLRRESHVYEWDVVRAQ